MNKICVYRTQNTPVFYIFRCPKYWDTDKIEKEVNKRCKYWFCFDIWDEELLSKIK